MGNLIIMSASLLAIILMTYWLIRSKRNKNKDNNTYKYFIYFNITLIIHLLALIVQIIFSTSNIEPIYFDYITYIGASYTPIFLLFIAFSYSNHSEYIKKFKWLYFIPIVFLAFLFTNDLHNLFYIKYSIYLSETVYGPVLIMYAIYSYFLFIFSMILIIRSSVKRSGFFSKQTLLIVLGMALPTICNLIGLLKILPLTIYVMPIMFIFTSICCSFAIFRYKALNITPVAFRTVIDTMSDAYVVISDDGTIVDTNKTFVEKFKEVIDFKRDENFFELIMEDKLIDIEEIRDIISLTRRNGDIITREYHITNDVFDRYFDVDIHPIKAKGDASEYVGTLLLFKDITQHKNDMKELNEKQDIIVKQGQLVSIGELAGGLAHDINTPISAIKTGILMLEQMGSEKTESEKEILQRMDNCAIKIVNIVNSVRNQIRNLGGDTSVKFKISDVINDTKVITFHEATKNKSEVIIKIIDDLEVKGDPTKLGQVITNLVVNAIQAYGNDKGGKVELIVERAPGAMAMIKVVDYAGGLDPEIIPYVFKNMLTTKGTFGTGLGLYLAYSVIKGNFNGEITFSSEQGERTIFYVSIPVANGQKVEKDLEKEDTI